MTLTESSALLGLPDAVLTGVGFVVAATAALAVHALGHYYAGRQISGVPATAITVGLGRFPQHVALRDDGDWVTAVESRRYRAVYREFDPELDHFERFVAGGDIVQAAVVVPVALALAAAGFQTAAGVAVVGSLLATATLVAADAVRTKRGDGAAGDYSTLWVIEWRVPVLILLGSLFFHLGVFWAVA